VCHSYVQNAWAAEKIYLARYISPITANNEPPNASMLHVLEEKIAATRHSSEHVPPCLFSVIFGQSREIKPSTVHFTRPWWYLGFFKMASFSFNSQYLSQPLLNFLLIHDATYV
jgi:hypothetical protein